MSAPVVATETVALEMMRKGEYFTARDLTNLYGVPFSRAHSIMSSLSSTPRYLIERVEGRPVLFKVLAVDGVRASGPSWFDVVLYSKWPVRQQVAA